MGCRSSAAFIKQDESPWVLGAVVNNIWSIGSLLGDSDRTNQLFLNPFVNYHFADGWSVGSSPDFRIRGASGPYPRGETIDAPIQETNSRTLGKHCRNCSGAQCGGRAGGVGTRRLRVLCDALSMAGECPRDDVDAIGTRARSQFRR